MVNLAKQMCLAHLNVWQGIAAIQFSVCHFATCLSLSLSHTKRYFSELFHILLKN